MLDGLFITFLINYVILAFTGLLINMDTRGVFSETSVRLICYQSGIILLNSSWLHLVE